MSNLENIDSVIKIIKKSETVELAKQISYEKMFAKNSGKKLLVAENKN